MDRPDRPPVGDRVQATGHVQALEAELARKDRELARLMALESGAGAIAEVVSECYYSFRRADGRLELELEWIFGPHERVLGHDKSAMRTATRWGLIVHPDDREILRDHIRSVERGGRHETEFRVVGRDDEERWVYNASQGVFDDDGLARWYGVVRSIRGPMRAASESRLAPELAAAALDRSAQPMVSVQTDGRIIYANAAAAELTGYPHEELITMGVRDIDPTMSHDRWRGHVEALRTSGGITSETSLQGPNGERRTVETHDTLLARGADDFIFSVITDVTDRTRISSDRQKALEEAVRLSDLKTRFLSSISHEVRTPLNAILGFSSMLDDDMPEKPRKFLQVIERSGRRLLDSLDAILNLTMLDSGSFEIREEAIDAGPAVGEYVEAARSAAEDKGLSLSYVAPDADVRVSADRAALERIVGNLLSNAVKFTSEGNIEVRVEEDEERVKIVVEDTGLGMSADMVQACFEEFRREEAGVTGDHDGIGLGLTIALRLARLMNGSIEAQSTPGRGTSLTVVLPRLASMRRRGASRSVDEGEIESEDAVRPRVLAVEDNPDMLALLRHLLEKRFDVCTASDKTGALAELNGSVFDAILMDINLGTEETGVDVLHALRELPAYTEVPVVAVTAYALPGDRERFLREGFDGYIGKPFTRQQLFRMLDQILT